MQDLHEALYCTLVMAESTSPCPRTTVLVDMLFTFALAEADATACPEKTKDPAELSRLPDTGSNGTRGAQQQIPGQV